MNANAEKFVKKVLNDEHEYVDYDEMFFALEESEGEQFDAFVRFSYFAGEIISTRPASERPAMIENAREFLRRIATIVLDFNLVEASVEIPE